MAPEDAARLTELVVVGGAGQSWATHCPLSPTQDTLIICYCHIHKITINCICLDGLAIFVDTFKSLLDQAVKDHPQPWDACIQDTDQLLLTLHTKEMHHNICIGLYAMEHSVRHLTLMP